MCGGRGKRWGYHECLVAAGLDDLPIIQQQRELDSSQVVVGRWEGEYVWGGEVEEVVEEVVEGRGEGGGGGGSM